MILDLWLVLTVDDHINWELSNVCTSHHHAGEGALVAQFGRRKHQAGVWGPGHAAFVFISGADWGVQVFLLDQQVSWKPLSFVLENMSTVHLLRVYHIRRWLPVQTHHRCHTEGQMHALTRSVCTQTGRGSDMISGCQTDSTGLNPLTSRTTYVFPFSDEDIFCLYGSIVARNLECLPIQAGNCLQSARCKREKVKPHFSITFSEELIWWAPAQHEIFWLKIEILYYSECFQASAFCTYLTDVYQYHLVFA